MQQLGMPPTFVDSCVNKNMASPHVEACKHVEYGRSLTHT
jgi:hypothetical protein